MKACGVSGADGEVVLLELPEPPSPGPGQVLLGVEAAGVGPWDRLLNDAGWDVGLRPPAALGVEGARGHCRSTASPRCRACRC